MLTTRLSLAKTLVDVFTLYDVYDQLDDLHDEVLRVVEDVDRVEAVPLPSAFADVARLLESDLLRWRALGDLAVALDMFELVPALLEGLHRSGDVHQAGNLAALSVHPAVAAPVRREVETYVLSLAPPERIDRMLAIRLNRAEAENDLEHALAQQMWPGRYRGDAGRPVVYVLESEAEAHDVWHAIAVLTSAGARVRRLPAGVEQENVIRGWASPTAPVVHWSGAALAYWRTVVGGPAERSVLVAGGLESSLEKARLVNRVRAALNGRLLRPRRDDLSMPEAFTPETLGAGAYDVPEMRYLAAASRHSLHRLAQEGLTPRAADVQRWSFSQLVAVRLVQGFRAAGMRYQRQAVHLVQTLDELASTSTQHRVGLGTDGDVYIDSGDGFRNARTNQQAFNDVLSVDDAFRPFALGDGAVPDLLRPGRFTTVHPLTLGGTPCIEDRRISARALALASVGGQASHDVLRSAYPELSEAQLSDGLHVGAGILAVVGT